MFGKKIKNKIKEKINKKIIIIAMLLLAAGATFIAYASGVVFSENASTQNIISFTNVGTTSWTVPEGVTSVEVLVVAGGGGGGGSTAGGGGGGGVIYNSNYVVASGENITVVIGSGGAGSRRSDQGAANNTNGENSVFGTLTAIGGGYGFSGYTSGSRVASSGGSGGGAGYYSGNNILISSPGSGTVGQGYSGGTVAANSHWGGAGGGGAGGVGSSNSNPSSTRTGGIGAQYDISGISTYYGGGGGGGVYSTEAMSLGGLGGGGSGGSGSPTIAQAGATNTGGGGGGGGAYQNGPGGGAGGSGIVIVRYSYKPKLKANSIQKGLVGYWPLDGNSYDAATNKVTDKTPYGNNGTNYGATLTTDRNGQVNGAMSFNGSNNYVLLPNLGSFQSFTIAGWIKGVGDSLIGGTGYNTFVGKQNSNRLLYNMSGIMLAQMGAGNHSSSIVAPRGQWNYIVYVYNYTNTTAKWYINGNPDSEKVGAISFGQPIKIGAYDAANYMMNGSIADVRIYSRALSQDEISTLYDSYKPKLTTDSLKQGLVLDMPLTSKYTKTETVGSEKMTDRTPYSNDGQNYGATVGADFTSFNGAGNYINTGHSANLDPGTNDFSVVVWAKADSGLSGKGVINKGGWGSRGFAISEAYSPANRYFFVINDGGYKSISLPLYEVWDWKQIIGIKTTNHFEAWVNGVKVGQWNGTLGSLSNPAKNFEIGRSFNPSYFNGSISGVKVYNRALTPAEIATLYSRGR